MRKLGAPIETCAIVIRRFALWRMTHVDFMGLMPLLTLAVWIYSLTIGYSGEIKKLPVIGDIAEQYYQTQP